MRRRVGTYLGIAGRSGLFGVRHLKQDVQFENFQVELEQGYELGPNNQSQSQGMCTNNKGNGNCQVESKTLKPGGDLY